METPRRLARAVETATASASNSGRRVSFDVKPIPGKGLACVANRDISIGERVWAERPLVISGVGAPPLAETFANALRPSEREAYYTLCQNTARFGDQKSVEGIFGTNGMPIDNVANERFAVFLVASRFNHGCHNNAFHKWNEATKCLTVHACRPIRCGEELVICYGFPPGCLVRAQRRQHLRDKFGFECVCAACSLEDEASVLSDQRREKIGDQQSLVVEMLQWAKEDLVTTEAAVLIERLDERLALAAIEAGGDGGHYYGVETLLHACVQFGEQAALRLLELIKRASSDVGGDESDPDALLNISHRRGSPAMSVKRAAMQQRVDAYVAAARRWAERARDVTRDLKGEDSPAFLAWESALQRGFWQPGGPLTFHQLWIDVPGWRKPA